MRHNWTQEENALLIREHKQGVSACAAMLNRSESSVGNRMFRLGLVIRRIWDDDKIAFLREHYSTDGGPDRCVRELGLKMSQIKHMASAQRLSLTQYECSKITSSFDYDYFTLDKPDCCYALGLLWADGHLDKAIKRVGITLVKEDFQDVSQVFTTQRGWKHRELHTPNRRAAIQARAHHILWYQFLVEHDYLIKSGTSATKILNQIPAHLKHYWWRGYFDGDGWFSFQPALKYAFGISSCVNQDWSFFESLSLELGLKHFISRRLRDRGDGSEVLCANYDSVVKFGQYIYQGRDQDGLGLTRKWEKFHALCNAKANAIIH